MREALRGRNLAAIAWLPGLLALLGGVVYLAQSWVYAHSQLSLLDEGAYLLKGTLYASGKYRLYQDYGPWANHMPLAFLIPGWAQAVFGAGLRTGRYLSVGLGLLLVAGLWVATRRVGGRWWAAWVVWAMALNPAVIEIYSLANSQVLLACMLVWVLVLTLGEARPRWQLLLGAALAGAMVVTRVNLSFVLPILVLYLGWQSGWRMGLWAAISGALPILIVHGIFWPNILRIWAHWLPLGMFPFLKLWAHPAGSAPSWNPVVSLATRGVSFFSGFRFHFVALVGALTVWLLWPRRSQWRSPHQLRMAVFLSVLLGVMTVFHMGVAIGDNYCVFCYPVYLSFFSFLGLILIALTFAAWESRPSRWRQALAGVMILLVSSGLGYAAAGQIGNHFLPLLDLQLPRMRNLAILPGRVELRLMLQNRFGLTLAEVTQMARYLFPTLAGLLVGIVLLVEAGLIVAVLTRSAHRPIAFGKTALILFLGLGFVLSPTALLGGGYSTYDCGGDVLRGYETAGAHLAQSIPPGSRVYWKGGKSAVPLLYLPDVRIFPAQINGDYSYRLGGDVDDLERYGFWSEALARRWIEQADFVLVEGRLYQGWLRAQIESGDFSELPPSPPTVNCYNNSEIHIFRRNR